VDYIELLEGENPTTSLFASGICFVLAFHVLCREVALLVGEVYAVQANQVGIKLSFDLFGKIINSISIQKTRFRRIMTMQIQIKEQPFLRVIIIKQLRNRIDSRLLLKVVLVIIAIKILIIYVHSIVSMIHAIRVYHWYEFEHEMPSQNLCSNVSFVEQKV